MTTLKAIKKFYKENGLDKTREYIEHEFHKESNNKNPDNLKLHLIICEKLKLYGGAFYHLWKNQDLDIDEEIRKKENKLRLLKEEVKLLKTLNSIVK